MFHQIDVFTFNYHWLPVIIGALWMGIVSYKDSESMIKVWIFVQFCVVAIASQVIELVASVSEVSPLCAIVFSSATQFPLAAYIALRYIDSNRGLVAVFATLISIIANTFLIFDFYCPALSKAILTTIGLSGELMVKPVYNVLLFIINLFAIGSCSRRFSDAFAWLVFGGPGSVRSSIRRRLADWEIKTWGGEAK